MDDEPLGVMARVSQLHATLRKDKPPLFTGHIVVKSPLAILNRFVPAQPLHGWVAFAGDVRNDGSFKLPEADGKITGRDLGLGAYRLTTTFTPG